MFPLKSGFIIPQLHLRGGEGGVYCFTSVRPSFRLSKIFFVAFFSATIDGRNLIFGHKLHIGMPYCGNCSWTRQIPTSCLLTFIHIEHICGGYHKWALLTHSSSCYISGHIFVSTLKLKVIMSTKKVRYIDSPSTTITIFIHSKWLIFQIVKLKLNSF
jgi:hypothetical protein